MKKRILITVLMLVLLVICSGCHRNHKWLPADCTNPKTCSVCGETEGGPLGHDWEEPKCKIPKTCRRCQATEGEALGHDWGEADCQNPKRCKRCYVIDGKPLGHDVTSWVIQEESTCSKEGKESGVCLRCGKTVNRRIKLKGHTRGTWQITKEPSSSEEGIRVLKCSVCGKIIEKEHYELTAEELKQLYKNECKNYDYNTIARNPDDYKGHKGHVSGKVVQVIESENEYMLRIAMNGSHSNIILVTYIKPVGADRILDDDWVNIYGIWMGTSTYESVLGASITIPLFNAEYLDIS